MVVEHLPRLPIQAHEPGGISGLHRCLSDQLRRELKEVVAFLESIHALIHPICRETTAYILSAREGLFSTEKPQKILSDSRIFAKND